MTKFYPLKLYFRNKSNILLIALSLFLNLCIWVWLLLNIGLQEDSVFLHYNVLFGVDLTGQWYQVYSVPILGLFLILFNAAIGWLVYDKDEFVALLSNGIATIIHIFLLVAASILVFLNV